ncbi:MAG TPA: metallophosphoesterase [Sandaracinaceae bacterium]
MRHTAACLTILLSLACDGPPVPVDAGQDSGPVDAGPLLPTCEATEAMGTDLLEPVASTLVATIVPAERLSTPGPRNPATEEGETMYRAMGLDRVSRGPGLERVRRTDLGDRPPSAAARRSIAWFVHYSDFQLADDESPARVAQLDNPVIGSGLRAQEAYLPRAISAMNRTLARIERPDRPYDFGIVTGDCADSGQANELRWVMEIMNGAPGVHTDSGEDDDPLPGPDNDPKDPFDAAPFPAPWLYVPGNHDVLTVGISLPTEDVQARATGTSPVGGTRDYRRWYAPVTTRSVPADPERRILSREEIVAALLADGSDPGPVGHGFPPDADLTHGANYRYDAIDGLLRILALDTSDYTGGAEGLVRRSTVDEWLVPELGRAVNDGVLVILASHHATSSIDVFRGQIGTEVVPDAVPPDELERIVASYPNVIAWLVGHSHDNRVRAVAGADAAHPGYWEIMTSAIADYPGQARLIEIVDNGNDTLSIFATLVDFDANDCMERRYRRLLTMEWASGWADDTSRDPADLDVELVIPLPESARTAVEHATGFERIESETTLRGT